MEELTCPLITPYTTLKGVDPETLEKLYFLRKWDIQRDDAGVIHNPVPFKWPELLRKTIYDIDNECDSGVPLELRQYQLQMIHHLIRMNRFINGDAVGLGKAQPLDAKVLSPSGWRRMGDLVVGDLLVDPDGGHSTIEGIYPQGEQLVYRVETSDGESTECSGDHLWTIQTSGDRMRKRTRTWTTDQIIAFGLHRPNSPWNVSRVFLPLWQGDTLPLLARAIKSITPVGIKPVQCIRVSSKRNLYITDGFIVTHNTLDVIAAAAWLKQRKPEYKIVIVTTKSTTLQWADEFLRFSYLRPYVMKDTYRGLSSSEARYAQMESFFKGDKKDVMIVKYDSIKGVRKKIKGKFDAEGNPIKGGKETESGDVKFFTKIFKENKDRLILVFDEVHKFKGTGTAIRNLVFSISRQADKVWGLTATVMKNSLNEFYAVATALGICPFGFMPEFIEEFCIMRPQYIGGGRKKMVLVGYQNIAKFKAGIRPFFLGRSQRQVKEPLPRLSTIYHPLDLTDQQIDLLEDIKNGVFILPPALIKDADGDLHEMERDPDNLMTQLSVQQLVANHPALLDPADIKEFYTPKLSPKEEALLDMLDGDLAGEKVIVFSKYKRWIDRMGKLTKDGHFTDRKYLRITGNENEKQRNDNKRLFQGSPDHNLIVVNAAGIEGINLQQAAHMVLLDVPWSWGDLIQLVGRMVRMASPHTACTLHILVAKGTIDEYAIETLKGKKGVFEQILGESHSAGILDDGAFLDLDSGMEAGNSDEEYKSLLKAHVKKIGLKTFLDGDQIESARGNKDYQMVFQKERKTGTKKKKSVDLLEMSKSKWGVIEEL